MPDEITQPHSQFDLELEALRQIIAEADAEAAKGRSLPRPSNLAAQTQRRGPVLTLDDMPELPRNALEGPQEARSSLSPAADAFMGATGLPTSVGPAVDLTSRIGEATGRTVDAMNPLSVSPGGPIGRAGGAVGDYMINPSIPTAANAAFQTGLATFQPATALKTLGAGYAAAGVKDLIDSGAFGPSEAEAAGKKAPAPAAPKLPGLDADQQRMYEQSFQKLGNQDYSSNVERRQLEDTLKGLRELSNQTQLMRSTKTAETQAKGDELKQAEDARQVAAAVAAREKALSRVKRFSDTNVGQLYDASGGYAPVGAAAFFGGLTRAATGGGKGPLGSIMYNYVVPAVEGTLAGIGAANVPLAYNALATEPDNPEKEAWTKYAFMLPEGHPEKARAQAYADGLPDKNPIRTNAAEEFYDPDKMKERAIMGGIEGFLGGPAGANAVRIGSRGKNALMGGSAPKNPPAGGSEPPSPAPAPAPAAEPALPAGVKLDRNGVPYNAHTGHKIRSTIFKPRGD